MAKPGNWPFLGLHKNQSQSVSVTHTHTVSLSPILTEVGQPVPSSSSGWPLQKDWKESTRETWKLTCSCHTPQLHLGSANQSRCVHLTKHRGRSQETQLSPHFSLSNSSVVSPKAQPF